MVDLDGADPVGHRRITDLPALLEPGDVVVINDTRVLPARVRFTRSTGGSGEVLLLDDLGNGSWEALVRPSAKLPPGTSVEVDGGMVFDLGDDLGDGRRIVVPRPPPSSTVLEALERCGEMPLPPYLGDLELDDPERYQTVYARRPASAAAPTAGLHLTDGVLSGLAERGVEVVAIELVVGLGTFRPISTDEVELHEMHAERYRIDRHAWDAITEARRVVAIGTTAVRAVESAAVTGELEGSTDIYITREHNWRAVDVLLTNFHLPRSSLLVMLDAFIGTRWRELYRQALDDGYRFLSFGDAMLVARAEVR